MKPDHREMVRTLSETTTANKSPFSTIGTLEALLWMALDDLPEEKAEFYRKLINSMTIKQG